MLRISNMVTEILTSEDTVRVVDGLSLTLNRRNLRFSRRVRVRQIYDGFFSAEIASELRTSLERCCYR